MEEQNNAQKGQGHSWIIYLLVILLFLGFIGSCMNNSSSDDDEDRCSSCHKTFTNNDDVKSIAWTSMCERCYSNYKYTQDLKEELKKYEENYGY